MLPTTKTVVGVVSAVMSDAAGNGDGSGGIPEVLDQLSELSLQQSGNHDTVLGRLDAVE